MGTHPLVSVGNLKILFWVDPPLGGGKILEKLKNPNLPHVAHDGEILLRHLLRHLLRDRAERGRSTGWPANGFYLLSIGKRNGPHPPSTVDTPEQTLFKDLRLQQHIFKK